MKVKVNNNFPKKTKLNVVVENDRVLLVSPDNRFCDITECLDNKDLSAIRHTGRAIGIVKDSETIHISYLFNYHTHSNHSLLDGMSKINQIAGKSSGISAITDHGNIFNLLKWQNAMDKEGKYAVFGEEVYCESFLSSQKEGCHLILLAKNEVGKKNLFLLSSNAYNNFYKKPHVSLDDLKSHSEGLICTSACLAGEIARTIGKNYDAAQRVAMELKSIFGEDFYLEIQRHNIDDEQVINPLIVKLGNELNIKLVAANDSHYLNEDDAPYHEILLCINQDKKLDEEHWSFDGNGYHYMTDEEMTRLFWDMPEVIANTIEIAFKCNLSIETGVYHLPNYDVPDGYTPETYLKKLIEDGFERRYLGTSMYNSKEYRDRLEYETKVILEMGYATYFLIVWDYVNWSKSKGILVGPGRGSAAGSLVSYCLEITDLDPIKYGLLFERFLNPERVSMPDIDMDFCYERRQEVIDYVRNKYGSDKVCNIVTFGNLKAKSVVQDVARALADYSIGMKISALISDSASNLSEAIEQNTELTSLIERDSTVKQIVDAALRIEGTPRNTSTHACGIIVSDAPLKNYIPTFMANSDDDKKVKSLASQVTMTEAEELGMLKMDFLGLRTMTVIGNTIESINDLYKKNIGYYREIPLNDPYVYEDISKGTSLAVFQIESEAMRAFMSDLFADVSGKLANIEQKYGCSGYGKGSAEFQREIERFGDELFERMIAGISLYRPGPMDFIPEYIQNMNNPSEITYDTPLLKPVLSNTYGIIVYQEQCMQIVRDLAGFSMAQADLVRKGMAKKRQEVLDELRPYFIYGSGNDIDSHTNKPFNIKGCIANGINEDIANKIWTKMEDFAKYAFNKSHAAVYAVLTMTCAWLKFYYPICYMSSIMNSYLDNNDKLKGYISVTKNMGIDIRHPDINKSSSLFLAEQDGIRFGLKGLSGLNANTIHIVEERRKGNYESIDDFISRTYKYNVNKKALSSLIYAGAFDSFPCSRKAKINSIEKLIRMAKDEKKSEGQLSFFKEINAPKVDIKDEPEYPKQELLLFEKEVSGMYLSEHPLDEFGDELKRRNVTEISLLRDDEGNLQLGHTTIAGIIQDFTIRYTKKDNRPLATFILEDRASQIKGVLFPDDYVKFSHLLKKNTLVVVKGMVQNSDFGEQLLVSSISPLEKGRMMSMIYVKLNSLDDFKEINPIINKYKGNVPIIVVCDGKYFKANDSVNASSALFMALQNKFGNNNVIYR